MRSLFIKRVIDASLAGAGLVALAPVMAATAWAVRRDIGSPVLFRQTRLGKHGVPFEMAKFRTMRSGPGSDAQRLTQLGRFLRATSLDELPELWHVVKGEMSLVGPRPLLPQYWERYNAEQRRRHAVPPGLTGWAQVNGRNARSWDEKFAFDTWYVDHWSNELDAKILWRTVRAVLRREGISHSEDVTMPEFLGTKQRG